MTNEPDKLNQARRLKQCDDKFNTIFNLTSAASKIINSDLTILRVNKALTELLDYSAEEIEGTQILDYACEEYKPHWHEVQKQLWTNQVPFFKLEACLHRKDGALVWVAVTTILFEDGDETFGFTVLDDITAEKENEDAQRRLQAALRYTKVAVWEMDLATKSIIRSDGHDQLLGCPDIQKEWTLENYFAHICTEDLQEFKNGIDSVSSGGAMDLQVRLHSQENAIKWVNFQAKQHIGANGKPMILGTISDVTKDKLIERQREDFISIASHELKTPVTSLKASLQLLDRKTDSLEKEVQVMISQANKSVNKITFLIDDLLSASKNLKSELQLKKTTFNLSKLIAECVQLSMSESSRVVLEVAEDLEIYADIERLERVMINLLTNVEKYAPYGPVTISAAVEGGNVRVTVGDEGPGISSDKQPLLFDRYYQAAHTEAKYSGLGLGLFISTEIIKKHGGEIGVESTLGAGSRFWFTIPLCK